MEQRLFFFDHFQRVGAVLHGRSSLLCAVELVNRCCSTDHSVLKHLQPDRGWLLRDPDDRPRQPLSPGQLARLTRSASSCHLVWSSGGARGPTCGTVAALRALASIVVASGSAGRPGDGRGIQRG